MSIFKAYDIRGIYGKEIDENTAYNLGRSFVLFLNKKNCKVVVSRDGRISSVGLFKYLKKGIMDQGGNAIDVGMITTPMFYFSVASLGVDGGINVTASHNPKEYNGFKIVGKGVSSVGRGTGLEKIEKIFHDIDKYAFSKKGKSIKKDISKDYLKFISSGFKLNNFDSRVGIDTANSVSGEIIEDIFKRTNCKIFHLFKKVDGRFPNHGPDPTKKENQKDLIELVKDKKLDLGIGFDGDGDRIMLVDEKGSIVPLDMFLALISEIVLSKKKIKVLYDIRSSNIVEDVVKENGGTTVRSRIGHSFIRPIMSKKNVFIGGEYSGHFYLNKKYCFEEPFFFIFTLLGYLKDKKLSEVMEKYRKYFHSGEINFKTDEKEEIIKKLEKKYKGKKTKIDGLRIDFKDYWFLVRASNTEPILRLVVEAKSKDLMEKKVREISTFIG